MLPLVGEEQDEVLRVDDGHGDQSRFYDNANHHDLRKGLQR